MALSIGPFVLVTGLDETNAGGDEKGVRLPESLPQLENKPAPSQNQDEIPQDTLRFAAKFDAPVKLGLLPAYPVARVSRPVISIMTVRMEPADRSGLFGGIRMVVHSLTISPARAYHTGQGVASRFPVNPSYSWQVRAVGGWQRGRFLHAWRMCSRTKPAGSVRHRQYLWIGSLLGAMGALKVPTPTSPPP